MKAIVTGAARGIGKCLAYELALRNYELILVDKDLTKLRKTQAELTSVSKLKVKVYQLDLANLEEVKKFTNKLTKEDFELFINNAGVGYVGNIVEQDVAKLMEMVGVNLVTPLFLTRVIAQVMSKRGGGKIINIASIDSYLDLHFAGCSVYSSTKRFMQGVSVNANFENKRLKNNVHILTINPGVIKTRFHGDSYLFSDEQRRKFDTQIAKYFTSPKKLASKIIKKGLQTNKKSLITIGRLGVVARFVGKMPPCLLRRTLWKMKMKLLQLKS